MRPKAPSVCATTSSTCCASVTSHSTASARRPAARTPSATGSSAPGRRLHTTTSAPTPASSSAIDRPMPWLAPVTMATRSRRVSAAKPIRVLLNDRVRGGDDAGDLDLLAVDEGGHSGRDLVLPVVALVDGVVEALALAFALEAAEPHVDARVVLAHEAAEDHHPHLDLERDDLLLHALDPLLLHARTHVVLAQLEEHPGLLA